MAHSLGIEPTTQCRVQFNEITKEAVRESIKTPRAIDPQRVDAQQARRVLDRLVGYNLSPLLWEKVRGGLSAGRVQSAAVKLICDRQREIDEFRPQEYWTVRAELLTPEQEKFSAQLVLHGEEKVEPKTEAEAAAIAAALRKETPQVAGVVVKERRRSPDPLILPVLAARRDVNWALP